MNILIILAILFAGSLASYAVSRTNTKLGAFTTILVSGVTLVLLLLSKGQIGVEESLAFLTFKGTYIGWYFSLIMVLVYFSTSFFNPFWMEKYIYPSSYNFLFLLSLAGTVGLFFARDLVTLFLFWEIVVWSSTFIVPMGKSRKASVVYFALSAFGSMATLYAVLLTYSKFGTLEIMEAFKGFATEPVLGTVVFFLFILSGLTKIGIFPFHIWLPMAHGSAPNTFSPVLSGGLVKMGAYMAYLAVMIFPSYEVFANAPSFRGIPLQLYILMLLGAVSMVVGTLMAIKQEDAKKLIAYSSVANGGYILVGVILADQLSFAGSMMHLLNHAIASAAAFLAIAAVAYRTGTTKISELGGIIHRMPLTYITYLIAIISLAGIPPMGGFVSKWLIVQGLADRGLIFVAAAAFFGSIGSFLYVFRPLAAVFLGQLLPEYENIKEANILMLIPMFALTALTLFFGVFPGFALRVIAEAQAATGITPVDLDGSAVVMATNGYLDTLRVFVIFGFGYVISQALFLSLPGGKKVGLMDTYTSAEFIYDPNKYHYASDFYAPFERLYKNHPDIPKLYDRLAVKVKELGEFMNAVVFSPKPGVAALLISVVVALVILGGKLI